LFVTSFRPPEEIKTTGWWTFFSDPQLTLENYQDVLFGASSSSGQLASYFVNSPSPIGDIAQAVVTWLGQGSWLYVLLYFLLTVGFTYFYTAFTFKPDETAEQLRKNGGFIPGIRPGRPTQDYLARVVTRITFAGALFLAIVAVSPSLLGLVLPDLATLGLGGTSLLIVVSVVVETMKQIEAQLMMRNYEGFIR